MSKITIKAECEASEILKKISYVDIVKELKRRDKEMITIARKEFVTINFDSTKMQKEK